ncbi:MAG: glutamate--tRNA ligase family protein, partial [Dehalococcoidales bacterium]
HGAVSITEYQEQGYLPEAMVNFLALLGWSLDDKTEIMSRQELVDSFSLERVSQAAAIFNQDKLKWMNGIYIRKLDSRDFVQRSLPFLDKDLPPEVARPLSSEYVGQIMPLVQERARTLAEVTDLVEFFLVDELEYDTELLIGKNMSREAAVKALEVSRQKLSRLNVFDDGSLEAVLRPLAEELELKTGQLFGVLRIAVTGRLAAPPLFQTMTVLGKGRCLKRIEAAQIKLT